MLIVNALRDAGMTDIDLPALIFCGSQSAGKSSLAAALFGVPLPRAGRRACTRCVTEIRAQRCAGSKRMCARVSVRWEFDDRRKMPFKEITTELIGETSRRSDIQSLITEAQAVLLQGKKGNAEFENEFEEDGSMESLPEYYSDKISISSRASHSFVRGDHSHSRAKFTRNVVCVEVSGPREENLVGIDLPGLIQATEFKEDEVYIEMIRELVKDYMRRPNTLIVPVVSCKDDMENQGVLKFAKEADPDEERTLIVLTKADAIDYGCQARIKDLLL
eukprot:951669_1